MVPYIELAARIIFEGRPRPNRIGQRTIGVFGHMLEFDLSKGAFPLVTTRQINHKAIFAELVGFIRGENSAAAFRELGTKIWDANANENKAWLANLNRRGPDDLGRIYGVQWRDWRYIKNGIEHSTDQLALLLDSIKRDPFSRRHIVTAWNPGELDRMALPPCHDFFQCNVQADETGEPASLDMMMHMRSCDVFLGLPFNIASYAALTHVIAEMVGLRLGKLVINIGDAHIYESHLPEMLLQIRREPEDMPTLYFGPVTARARQSPKDGVEYEPAGHFGDRKFGTGSMMNLEEIRPENFVVRGYSHHPPLKGKMAV